MLLCFKTAAYVLREEMTQNNFVRYHFLKTQVNLIEIQHFLSKLME